MKGLSGVQTMYVTMRYGYEIMKLRVLGSRLYEK